MRLYIASRSESGGIYLCDLSPEGQISVSSVIYADKPAYLCRDGRTLYALLREPFQLMSGIMTYEISDNGDLILRKGPESTHGLYSAHIYARNGTVWCANYIDGTVLRLPDQMIAFNGSGPDPSRQRSSHPHCITPSPDGKYLCINDLGTDRIYLLTENLDFISEVSLPSGCGPRHLVFSRDGQYAYSSNEMGSSVSVMKYTPGHLLYLRSYSTIPEDYTGWNSASAIRLSADGDRLYVSNRGHNSVAVFSVSGCMLESVGFIPCFGNSPREMVLADDFLLCGNELSDNITVFSLKDGLPVFPVCDYKIEMPWCILPCD